MKTNIYLLKQGNIAMRDGTIEFTDSCSEKTSLPIIQIDSLYIFSGVSITSDCLKLLSDNGITIHYFDYYENYLGTFYPKYTQSFSGKLLVNQVKNFL